MIVCFGEVLWDIFPDDKTIGGVPLNVAANCARLDIEATLVTAIGPDELGKELLDIIDKKDIAVLVQRPDKPTGTSIVELDENKVPTFDLKDDVAWDFIEFDEMIAQISKEADFFSYGTLAQRHKTSRETLQKCLDLTKGVKIYDFNYRNGITDWKEIYRETITKTDILKSGVEGFKRIQTLYKSQPNEEAFAKFLMEEHNLTHIIVTKGDQGATMYTKKGTFTELAPKVNPVDTTGCGDAFTAGLVYALKNKFDEQKFLKFSVDLATKVATHKGAIPEEI